MKSKLTRTMAAVVKSCTLLLPSVGSANNELLKMQKDPNQWVMWGGDYAGSRYSKLDQINSKNVKNLRPAWTFSTGVLRGHEGSPLILGDTMYVHTPVPNKVFAINLDNQAIKWSYEPKQDEKQVQVWCFVLWCGVC